MFESFGGLFTNGNGESKASEYGDDSFTDQTVKKSGLLDDLKALGPDIGKDAMTLLEKVMSKGEPYDDRTFLMERIIVLTASLPPNSKMREKLSQTLVGTLWDSLQHPPLSYYGDEHQYRTADGHNNNIMFPDFGKAGMPYAKSVRAVKGMHGAKPDPGLLFDLLMRRPDGKFAQNPAGINSMLFYHATIIIHDIFRTNRRDANISDTSSYLDLSPLYGRNQETQNSVRTFKDGLLKPDTFAEERLLGQPPGVCVMLVMYSRFHNFAAQNIAAINEDGRFSMPATDDADYDQKMKKRDNDIFQTARLIVGGMYINISLHDYIRGITNVHHSNSTWTLDPRIEVAATDNTPAVERGVGNMVSAEFNLLYRFHSSISKRDDQWTDEFFRGIYGDKEPEKIGLREFYEGVAKYEASIPKEPSERTFGGLARDPKTGTFNDADLVKILRESMEDPAGAFGARNIPKHLRTVEILGILQARKWQVASLNEFRGFFGLKRHDSFESINPDPEIADLLRKLYDSPDMVELYPGLFVEDAKPRRDPGSGFTAPYTVGRAVLSDAVTLVRGDRFYTLDYTSATMTKWGMAEVQQNYETLGGSMLYRLIHRAVPKWFKFNSIYVMQPMYLPSMNQEIAKEFNTIDLYSLDPPAPPPKITLLNTHAAISAVLNDQANFKVKYGMQLPDLVFPEYMLQGDSTANRENHTFVAQRLMKVPGGLDLYAKSFEDCMRKILARESYTLGPHVARVVTVLTHADFLNLSIDNKAGNDEGLSEAEMYKCIVDYLNYANIDSDPAESWNLRREAHKSFQRLKTSTMAAIKKNGHAGGVIGKFFAAPAPPKGSLKEIGQKLTQDLLGAGYNMEKTACTLFTTAAGGIANIPSMFVQILDWFLRDENAQHWAAVRDLASKDTPEAFEQLKKYILEAGRLTSFLALVRICVPAQGQAAQIKNDQGQTVTIKLGEVVLSNVTAAFRDASIYPDPNQVKLDRPTEVYQMWSMGPHGCAGRAIAITALAAMTKVCAQLKNLRRAPGAQGQLKYVPGPVGSRKYLTDDWSRYQPFAGNPHYNVEQIVLYSPAEHSHLGSIFSVTIPILLTTMAPLESLNSTVRASLLGLSFLGLWGTWGIGGRTGFLGLIKDALDATVQRLPVVNEPVKQHYTAIWPVDALIRRLNIFLWPAIDGSWPGLSLVAWEFSGQFSGTWMMAGLEGLRHGNRGKLISYTTIIGTLSQTITYGTIVPFFLFLHVLTSPTNLGPTTSPSEDPAVAFLIEPTELAAWPIAFTLSYLIPTILVSLPSPKYTTFTTHQNIMALWEFYPIPFKIFQMLLARYFATLPYFKKQQQSSLSQRKATTLNLLRYTYIFAALVSSVSHIISLTLSLSSSLFPTLFTPTARSGLNFSSIFIPVSPLYNASVNNLGDGLWHFLVWNMTASNIAPLLWALLQYRNACEKCGRVWEGWGSVLGKVGGVAGLLGPAAGTAWVMWLRDSVVLGEREGVRKGK
ncbi:MAG: hypothetical protein Q9220_004395 [cf. Caloplaca sp. 1 TL-2023]